jgi:PAS domain S-box-containing protein
MKHSNWENDGHGMTLTRKFGAILLLLTAGSLAGIVAFAFFLSSTAGEGLYLIAAQMEQNTLQQLQIQTLRIRNGQEEARDAQQRLIEAYDMLITSMENGGLHPVRPIELFGSVTLLGRMSDTDLAAEVVIRTMHEKLPEPPMELKLRITPVRQLWLQIREPLRTIGQKAEIDPDAEAAYDLIKPKLVRIDQASRQIMVEIANRIAAARQRMLVTLASIAGLSVTLFLLGLWFTRRYISSPIELIEKSARQIRAGDFSHRIQIVSNDEVASLAITINEMCSEVERSVERYRELFENASDIVYTMSLDGDFLAINRAGERITGYPREEFLKMNMSQLLPAAELELSHQMMERKLSGEQPMTVYPIQFARKDGATISLEVSTRLIYENGSAVAVQGMARDITERRRLEEQLWVTQKMEAVGRLAGGIAHEFGNVLTIISGYCALILGSLKKDDPLNEEVEGIQKAAQRATSLIRHLLGFSKGQVYRPKVLELRETLYEIGGMLRRLIGDDIQLMLNCDTDLGQVRFDPAQFEQVMVNLALNARDAMPSGGQLRIEATNVSLSGVTKNGTDDIPAGDYVRVSVSDTGIGMSPDVLSKMFEPFFSTKERGTGLGLSTVYGILKQCGGSIAAESSAVSGTIFTMFLPRLIGPAEPILKEPAPPSAERGIETVLLVEDTDDVRMLVGEMLRAHGYHVISAENQQQALSICSQPDPRIHLLLTDVVMPEMSGPELVSRVRGLRPDMKVLYMSGYAQDKFESYIQKNDPFEFIPKPFDPGGLGRKVREVLDASANTGHGSSTDSASATNN